MKNTQNNDKRVVIVHGEAFMFHSELPDDAVEIKPSNNTYHIIADSETTGNHHVVDYHAGVTFYSSKKKNTMFMVNKKPTTVRCVDTKRHSPIKIGSNTWEFGIQKEYDHFAKNLQKVRD